MDWFEKLTGFAEHDYAETQAQLELKGNAFRSQVNGRRIGVGQFEMLSLAALREQASAVASNDGQLAISNVSGDVRAMHRLPKHDGAVFQVASQFNMLEMVSPSVMPEHGVTRYQTDRTQGPACAMAAGGATIYRNYFVPMSGEPTQIGQSHDRQLDGLAAIGRHLEASTPAEIDALRGLLCVGVHRDVEVTDHDGNDPPTVTQVFCSALPVAYSNLPAPLWRPFAQLVLEAAYVATLCAGVLNAARGRSNKVLLTQLGGGAFGNDDTWIDAATQRALDLVATSGLDIRLVSYGAPPRSMMALAKRFGGS